MTKTELRKLLAIYSKIRKAVINGESEVCIEQYGRKKDVNVPEWAYIVENCLNTFHQSSESVVCKIAEQLYVKGAKDHEIYLSLPISESGFYRIKQRIEERIYEICILNGYVTIEEIMSNIIQ